MKYPDDFQPFSGYALSNDEINALVQEALEGAKNVEPNDFNDLMYSIETGDTLVEVREFGHVRVLRNVAEYYKDLYK